MRNDRFDNFNDQRDIPAARGQMAQRRESHAQENPVTAIDIALEPDATMVEHAHADNCRLLKAFPKGFALDATHHPHLTMLQQFVAVRWHS